MTVIAPAVRAVQLTRTFGSGDTAVHALDQVTVDFPRGEFTAIMGPSGSGKSTLMHCVAGLDTIDSGRVWIGDVETTGLSDRDLTVLRRDRVGFVFQAFNLIPTLTARENIVLPLKLAGRRVGADRLASIVEILGLTDRLTHRPAELSGGQQQRVAIARALITDPEVVFADEPTGALDSQASASLLRLLRRTVDEFGQSIVMVTHDPAAAASADRIIRLRDGRIVANDVAAPRERVADHA